MARELLAGRTSVGEAQQRPAYTSACNDPEMQRR